MHVSIRSDLLDLLLLQWVCAARCYDSSHPGKYMVQESPWTEEVTQNSHSYWMEGAERNDLLQFTQQQQRLKRDGRHLWPIWRCQELGYPIHPHRAGTPGHSSGLLEQLLEAKQDTQVCKWMAGSFCEHCPKPQGRAASPSCFYAGETPASIWKWIENKGPKPSQQLSEPCALGTNVKRMRIEKKTLCSVKANAISKASVSTKATCWGIYRQLMDAHVNYH